MPKKFEFKKVIYEDDKEGILLEDLDDLKKFKREYSDLFNKNKDYSTYMKFKDIHVPISEGQPIIVLIKRYNHWQYTNNASWKEYNP